MKDETEASRKKTVKQLSSEVVSTDITAERTRLEEKYGQVWDVTEVSKDFMIKGFMAPYVVVEKKPDRQKGSLMFQHSPRFYFNFQPN
jgi:hypothetical protein